MSMGKTFNGKPYVENPHVRLVASAAQPRRVFLLHKIRAAVCLYALGVLAGNASGADFISVEGPVPEVNTGGCSTAVFVRPVTNRAAVASATWTVTGLGVFRVFLNSAEVGEQDFLKPGYTHPRKRRSSFSYDVTDAFRRGSGARNVLCAEVSIGWWRGGKLEWSFTVPPGTTATVVPPDGGPTVERGPGDYRMPARAD